MDAIKVGLLGYGLSGSVFHAPLLTSMDEFEINKVLSSKSETIKNELPNTEVVESIEGILEDEQIELVIITTPNILHYQMAYDSLQAGKHVILEKPMVIDVKEGEALVALAKKKQLMLSVYQNRRWDGDFLTVKKLIEEDTLGSINTYIAHYDRFNPEPNALWREKKEKGAGTLYDLGSHLIDQALHLFGEPQEVFADLWNQREASLVDDYFHIILGYQRMRVVLHSGSIVKKQGPKYLLHGSKGSFVKFGEDTQAKALIEGKSPQEEGFGEDREEFYGTVSFMEGEQEIEQTVKTIPGSYLSYYKGIYACIRNGEGNPVPAEDGLRTIKIIQTAVKSSKQKAVVRLY